MNTLGRRSFLVSCAAVAAMPSLAFASGAPLRIGVSVTMEYLPLFAAKDQGYFEAHGLDVSLTVMGNLPAITAGIVAGSLDMGTIGASHAILSYDAGLPLRAVAPCGLTPSSQRVGIVARKDAGIGSPKDLMGKRVGVPALRNNLDIGGGNLVIEDGGDFKKVNFVEVPLPQIPDLIASKQLDAGVVLDPVYGRALELGAVGMGHVYQSAPEHTPSTLYAASKPWADKNPDAIKAFRAAMAEGMAYVHANPEAALNLVSQYYKMSKDLVMQFGMPSFALSFDLAGLEWWVAVMQKQELLQRTPDLARFISV